MFLLYIKDDLNDYGFYDYHHPVAFPGGDNAYDIWVRNQPDGLDSQTHQNPEWNQSSPTVYAYVRVRNKSCSASAGTEKLRLNYSKAAGYSAWPTNFDGSNANGNLIALVTLPVIEPGMDTIIQIPWVLPNPSLVNWHPCVIARIENAAADPITEYPDRLDSLCDYNNNVALKNLSIVNNIPDKAFVQVGDVRYPAGGFMYLHNPKPVSERYNFTFEIPESPADATETAITHDAEVQLFFDSKSYDILEAAGAFSQSGVRIRDGFQAVLNEPSVTLHDVTLPAETSLTLYVGFSFLTDEITNGTTYRYKVWQAATSEPEKCLGTENFLIRKYDRPVFNADAGPDKTVPLGQSVTLQAVQLSEAAEYNWYNATTGKRVYSGASFTTTPAASTGYRLEVISLTDGFKDYDETAVKILTGDFTTVSPNPTTGEVTVQYQIENAASAQLVLYYPFNGLSATYPVDVTADHATIDLSTEPVGVYSLVLICSGQAMDVANVQRL